ncbi:type II toxin-antitoxin system tRNA(fMet)-specific endonuclease VapC [Desulfocurvus vexinensis]|uniref:type II toxin-antitoxin system tRNA(fMet)-specific endonuclease VapC n=1 Tax=Desulfocurvus vexinensis TaxID=399548 RepID=UPI000490004D|nr:type II toxin-antitoxin system VapC family toxin [Desulfocurvus vexinensis]
MKVLLDTNICIYMIKNRPPEVRKHFEQFAPGDIAISSITVAELHYGVEKSAARERNASALEAFLLPLEIVPFDLDSALAYGKIRADLEKRGRPIGGMDMLLAAQAMAQGFTLITHNLKEFTRIPDLKCETWVD